MIDHRYPIKNWEILRLSFRPCQGWAASGLSFPLAHNPSVVSTLSPGYLPVPFLLVRPQLSSVTLRLLLILPFQPSGSFLLLAFLASFFHMQCSGVRRFFERKLKVVAWLLSPESGSSSWLWTLSFVCWDLSDCCGSSPMFPHSLMTPSGNWGGEGGSCEGNGRLFPCASLLSCVLVPKVLLAFMTLWWLLTAVFCNIFSFYSCSLQDS